MAEPFFRTMEVVVPPVVAANGIKLDYHGLENIPDHGVEQLNTRLRETMRSMLYRVQEEYPHPAAAYRVPRRLGGSAPTPEDSKRLRAMELAERARKQRVSGR